jgi:hypothetical protein
MEKKPDTSRLTNDSARKKHQPKPADDSSDEEAKLPRHSTPSKHDLLLVSADRAKKVPGKRVKKKAVPVSASIDRVSLDSQKGKKSNKEVKKTQSNRSVGSEDEGIFLLE